VEGRLKESWRANATGLKLFWDGAYPGDRGFQYYSDLELAAERSGWWNLATVLQHETLHMLQEGDRIDVTAMAHFRLVGLLTSTGDLKGAQQELGKATELFTKLEDEKARRLYQAYSEISLATILLNHGELERASQHLQNAGPDFHQWKNFNINLRYLKTAAEIAHLRHDPEEKKLLTNLVSLGNSGFKSLRSGKDRWGWDHEIGPAYRRLLELEILQPHEPAQALADWEYYHAKAGPGMDLQVGPITGNATAKSLLQKQIAAMHHATLLTLAVFSNTVVAWLADDRGVREFPLNADPVRLSAEANQFYQLCSDQNSALQKVNASGSRLYELLIAPMETQLDSQRELFVEADGVLDRIPWSALVMTNGKYFGEGHTITNTPGLFYAANPSSTTGSGTVVVAEPGAVDLHGNRYLPLPHAANEAERIAAMYSGSVSLPGKKASLEALLAALPGTSIFHFAGHAANREYGGELLIHDETDGASLPASRVSSLTLRHMKLVVLSACSTAMSAQATSNDPDGLVSAFLQAGARSVVASSWDVDSKSTAEMMIQFHTLVKQGQPISRALTQSRDSVLANPETRHPFYWAAFANFQPVSLGIWRKPMKISRRAALTGLAASSLLPLTQSCRSARAYPSYVAYVNILLHGMSFMRFMNNQLIVHTPIFDDHKLFFATNGFLVPVPKRPEFDLTVSTIKLSTKGTVQDFKGSPQIPQFSMGDVNVGTFTNNYNMRLVLPWPEYIVPLRKAALSDFGNASNRSKGGKIAQSVYSSCGANPTNDFALVTCMRYAKSDSFGAAPSTTWMFYAEHDTPPSPDSVNAALRSVDQSSFFSNKAFDLSLHGDFAPRVCPDSSPGYGITPEDQNTLFEIAEDIKCPPTHGTDVANCVQFGING
jgi:CHAT domain-containing protein